VNINRFNKNAVQIEYGIIMRVKVVVTGSRETVKVMYIYAE